MRSLTAKMFLFITVIFFSALSSSMAATNSNTTGKWICTTNASSATSGSADANADKNMANNAKKGKDAFDYAYQHCRDCTEIKCSKQ